MNFPLKSLLVLLCCLTLSGCGYRIHGLSQPNRYTYYIVSINNNSTDLTITQEMRQYVTRFFSDRGALREQEDARYMLTVRLDRKVITTASESTTREAITSSLELQYSFTVQDQNHKIIFERSLSRSQTFPTGSTMASFNRMQTQTFRDLSSDILSEFVHRFENNAR